MPKASSTTTDLALVKSPGNNVTNKAQQRRIPGNNGGTLNGGGTRGNKGNRTSHLKKGEVNLADALARDIVTPDIYDGIVKVLKDTEHKQYGHVLGLALERAYGKPKQTVDVTTKEDKRLIIEIIPFEQRRIG